MSEPMAAEQIRELRARLGLTQQDFAVRVGTTVPTVSRWENGARAPRGLYRKALDDLARKSRSLL